MRVLSVVLLALAIAAPAARADDDVSLVANPGPFMTFRRQLVVTRAQLDDDDGVPDIDAADAAVTAKDRAPTWEGALGFDIGTFHTGPAADLAIGFDAAAGLRLARLAVLGEYRLLTLSPFSSDAATEGDTAELSTDPSSSPGSGAPSGYVQRLGIEARYSLLRLFAPCHNGSPCAVISDLWLEGGAGEQLLRWYGGGGINRPDVDFGLGWTIGGRGPDHHGGYFLEVRATLAGSPQAGPPPPPGCAGPCDFPTGPTEVDRSILFTTGFTFGG